MDDQTKNELGDSLMGARWLAAGHDLFGEYRGFQASVVSTSSYAHRTARAYSSLKTSSMPEVVPPDTCITNRTSGSSPSKVSFL